MTSRRNKSRERVGPYKGHQLTPLARGTSVQDGGWGDQAGDRV